MMRRLVLALMLFALLVACEQDAPNGPPKVTPPSDDVGQSPPPTRRLDAGRTGGDPTRVGTSVGGDLSALAYDYQDTRFTGRLEIGRRTSRISATTLSFTRLDRETVQGHAEALVTVEGGGVRFLRVSLPESWGEDLRFRLLTRPGMTGGVLTLRIGMGE